jgi:hypothetical protein
MNTNEDKCAESVADCLGKFRRGFNTCVILLFLRVHSYALVD